MSKCKNSATVTLIITDILFLVLICFVFLLPFGAQWYANHNDRPDSLPTVVISACYPCVPFAFISLFSLRKTAKNLIKGEILTKENYKNTKNVCLSCLAAGVILCVAGFFYFPFFIASGSAFFCSLASKVVYDGIGAYLSKSKDDIN